MKKNEISDPGRFRALTFDCYGTLIDWEAGIWDALQPLIMNNQCTSLKREQALEAFAVHESRLEAENPQTTYPRILQTVHVQVAQAFGLRTTRDLDKDFGDSIAHWPAFPDTADALRYLKTRFRLVILSNVSRAGFAASRRKLGVEFDAVYTAEDIGSYKPDPQNFRYMLKRLHADFGIEKADILHTAQSLFHDHSPAANMGLSTAWIDRQRLSQTGAWGATHKLKEVPQTDYLFHSMGEMADAVAAGLGASR
jgi:2-haloalkanoic acid dehalogenase type II